MANVFIPLHAPSNKQSGWPILALGFRPFYLLAAVWMVFALPLWLAIYAHGLQSASHLQAGDWHMHEMLFGFTGAIIVGFLFTAVRNWTNVATPSGWPLALLALIWIAARVLLLSPWSAVGALFDIAFYLLAAAGIGRSLLKSGNRRNYFFIALLIGLGAISALHHLAASHYFKELSAPAIAQAALDLILLIITIVAGRVLPMFTTNAVGATITRYKWLEMLLIPLTLLLLAGDLLHMLLMLQITAAVLCVLHAIRLYGWQPWRSVKTPILWILHASYGWMIIGFALKACGVFSPMSGLLATHAFTVGGIGGLCLGMMTRTARGHTGRPLKASTMEVWAYGLLSSAAVVRVLLPLILIDYYRFWVAIAGLLMVLAYVLFLIVFAPWLCQARVDGMPG